MHKINKKKYSLLERFLFPKTRINELNLKAKLHGKTIFITGASFGIGESIALMLAKTWNNNIRGYSEL